jgi:hypothetical protein
MDRWREGSFFGVQMQRSGEARGLKKVLEEKKKPKASGFAHMSGATVGIFSGRIIRVSWWPVDLPGTHKTGPL